MTGITRRTVLAGAASALAWPAFGETFPSHPIRMVVPFPAGGPLDLVARAVGDKLAASLKQPVVVENRSGAGGNLGNEAVAKAPPDGYSLLMTLSSTLCVNPWIYPNLPFDPIRDLRPLSILTNNSQMLVVHPSVPVKTVAEFVAYARKSPISYAHAGHGSPGHLAMEYFRLKAGFKTQPVPYRGNAQLVVDLLGGQIKHAFVATAGVIQPVRDGKLRGIAISALERSALAPDVPTVDEFGYPGFETPTFFVALVPAATPEPLAALLEREVRAAIMAPDLAERFRPQDIHLVSTTGAEAVVRIKAESELWRDIVKAAGMKAE